MTVTLMKFKVKKKSFISKKCFLKSVPKSVFYVSFYFCIVMSKNVFYVSFCFSVSIELYAELFIVMFNV